MTTLWIQILSGSGSPIYRQIVEQVSEAIAKGELSIGDKLPAVRTLASELVINPNTVARAYTVLEQARLVVTKTGAGTFVSDPSLRSSDAADINALTERMDTFITRGLNLGFETSDLAAMFEDRLASFIKRRESGKKNG